MKGNTQDQMKESLKISGKDNMTEKLASDKVAEGERIIKEEKKLEQELGTLRKKLDDANKLAEERLNQIKYLQADFDNYKKKFEKEREQIIRLANENLVKEFIAILDDFDASLKVIEKDKEGLDRLHRKFLQLLEKHGLKKIEALGRKFDPNFHEVLYKELSEHSDDEIIEEIQKGYTLQSKVIRPSRVKISKKEARQDLKTNLSQR